MAERIEWNGWKYRRYPESEHKTDRDYFKRSIEYGCAYLHRDVWEHHNGPIPDGYEIHHADEDTTNNCISNLSAKTPREHKAKHPFDDERLNFQREHLAKIRPLAKAWHSSAEGFCSHSENALRVHANFKPTEKPCGQCGKQFLPRKIGNADIFCSNSCKSAHRRASGVDDEVRKCVECGGSFTINRYKKTAACSRSCAQSFRRRAK